MKVLLAARDYPPDVGGVQNFMAGLAGAFPPDQITVLARSCAGWAEHDAKSPYKILRMPSFYSWPRPLALVMQGLFGFSYLLWQVVFNRPDIIFCGYVKTWAPFAWIMKKLFGVPYVAFAHGTDIVRYKDKGRHIRKLLIDADLVATISEHTKSFIEEFTAGNAKIVVVPLGVGLQPDQGAEPIIEVNGVPLKDKKVALSLSRLAPRKGMDKTIEAVSLLKDKHPDLLYVIAGGGPDRQRLEGIVKENDLADRVLFYGRVPSSLMSSVYKRADIYIMASRVEGKDVEGFGIVYLEAGIFGVPVIGGDSGGVRQAVGHEENGLLVDPNSPKVIADAMDRLLSDPELAQKLGKEGIRRATEVFTWENCRDTLLGALD